MRWIGIFSIFVLLFPPINIMFGVNQPKSLGLTNIPKVLGRRVKEGGVIRKFEYKE